MGLSNNGVVYALYDFNSEGHDELSFKMGDCLIILRKGDSQEEEWWWGCLEGMEGYIPRNLIGVSFYCYEFCFLCILGTEVLLNKMLWILCIYSTVSFQIRFGHFCLYSNRRVLFVAIIYMLSLPAGEDSLELILSPTKDIVLVLLISLAIVLVLLWK